MAGMNLMGSIGSWAGPQSAPVASSASEAAFGPGYTGTSQKAGSLLAPTHPMGIALWGGIGAVGFLAFLYRSLPADRRAEMELVLLMLVAWGPAKGLAKMSLQRLAQEGQTTGVIDALAKAGVWTLS